MVRFPQLDNFESCRDDLLQLHNYTQQLPIILVPFSAVTDRVALSSTTAIELHLQLDNEPGAHRGRDCRPL